MKITFMGAAQTVTGSCYILECSGSRFAVDCGMYQGNEEIEQRNAETDLYRPRNLDCILVTHAHIDHSGLLPRMAAQGYDKPIYCSSPTRDLLEIMLKDSAHIQEMEAEWSSTKRRRRGNGGPTKPLYTEADAEKAIQLLEPVEYDTPFEPVPGVHVTYRDAGHILGSAFIRLEYEEQGRPTSILFSGDLGRPDQLILRDPSKPQPPDYLVLESTYGDRNHKDDAGSLDELAEAISYSYANGEKVVIPAFAVERSQQIIYSLFLLRKQGRLPADMPVYLDSPLAIRATEIFRKHPEYFDDRTKEYLHNGDNPLDLPNLRFTLTTDESRAINDTPGSAIIISASGMATAGRIKHHLKHNLWRKGASIVFCGFQALGTTGRKIVDGAKRVRIFGEDVAVGARVFTIGGFSGHAGQSELLAWLKGFMQPHIQIILTHGEPKAQQALAKLLREQFGVDPIIPSYLEELELAPGKAVEHAVLDAERATPHVDWDYLLRGAETALAELKSRAAHAGERPWVQQAELRSRLLELTRDMHELISEM